MANELKFELSEEMIEQVVSYSDFLHKEPSVMMDEALTQYFINEEKKLLEKRLGEKNHETNLGFDEFWEDVDL